MSASSSSSSTKCNKTAAYASIQYHETTVIHKLHTINWEDKKCCEPTHSWGVWWRNRVDTYSVQQWNFVSSQWIYFLHLLLALQPTVGFSLLSDFLPLCPFLTQLSPPSFSHYLYIFFDVLNPSFPWSSSVSPTYWFPLQYSFRYSFFLPSASHDPAKLFFCFLQILLYLRILLGRSARNSFWFSRMHLHFALDQRFS